MQRIALIFALLASFILWYFSRTFFHGAEPAYNGIAPYLWTLLVLGALSRLIFRAEPKIIYGGVVAGQFLGAFARAGSLSNFCAPCHLAPVMLFAMASAFGAWVVSKVR